MQQTHDVIRGAFKDCKYAIEMYDREMLRELYADLSRCIATHTNLEDNGLFSLIGDYTGDLPQKAGLEDLHVRDAELQKAIVASLDGAEFAHVVKVFEDWMENHLEHLAKEEKVMTPALPDFVARMDKDMVKLGKIFNEKVLSPNDDDLAWFAGYNCKLLAKHGSDDLDVYNSVRIFVVALQHGSTVEQWEKALPEVKRSLPSNLYQVLKEEHGIESCGKVVLEKKVPVEATKKSEVVGTPVKEPNVQTKTSQPKKKKPLPFPVMRMCHETIRAGLKDCRAAIEKKDREKFVQVYSDLSRCIETHANLEDNGFFSFIGDYTDGLPKKEGMGELHNVDAELQAALKEALKGDNFEAVVSLFNEWEEDHLEHLSLEEKVLMPLVPKIAKTVGDPVELRKIFNERILTPNDSDLAWFAGYNCKMLSKHGSQKHDGFNATRVFLIGLQSGSTPAQWSSVLPEVKKSITPQQYDKLAVVWDIESPGKVATEVKSEAQAQNQTGMEEPEANNQVETDIKEMIPREVKAGIGMLAAAAAAKEEDVDSKDEKAEIADDSNLQGALNKVENVQVESDIKEMVPEEVKAGIAMLAAKKDDVDSKDKKS